ncbi:hypothetical protein VPMS16_1528 [Vibrio sp. 16]|nr:hypothetical protein VPMS16_1528 [Vibrio sp. 16]
MAAENATFFKNQQEDLTEVIGANFLNDLGGITTCVVLEVKCS